MKKMMISEIEDKIGPGDIVGALVNEAGISPGQIGNIEINKGVALVELEENIYERVLDEMQDKKIGGCSANYSSFSEDELDKLDHIQKYTDKFSDLVEKERAEEMRRHEQEIKNLSGYERENRGRAILHLRGRDQGTGLGNKYLIKYMRQKRGEQLPETEINIGDLVMISKNKPADDDNPTGTVIEKTNYSITVVFDNRPQGFAYDKKLRMDLYVNDITFQRMLEALDTFQNASDRLYDIRDMLLGVKDIEVSRKDVDIYNQDLDKSQIKAVEKAMGSEDIFLIHGPPGTGKTMTCIEVLQQAVQNDKKILATADSNVATDNLVERLVNRGVNAVRVGHPARMNPIIRDQALDYLLEDNETYHEAQDLREKAMELKDKQDALTHPSGRWRRGMSNSRIKQLADQGRGSRGVPPEKIDEMAEWLDIQEAVDDYFDKIDQLEEQAVKEILDNADVVCSTNSTAGSDILANHHFDLLVLDEATQSTEPSALIPLVKADKIVMAGDHKQLPPTILNEEASREGLGKSLFERLIEVHGNSIKQILKTQYRMNKDIMDFSGSEFYRGQIEADEAVKNWTLKDLDLENPKNELDQIAFDGSQPIVYFDSADRKAKEYSKKDSNSYSNEFEAELAQRFLETGIQIGLDPEEIALIAPYKDQVDLINKNIANEKIEIDTVDGFQGREKEVIILTLVRSNNRNEIGFLEDLRRLNVSLTRAKKKLIIIGDSETITTHQTFANLVDYVKKKGGYFLL